MPYWSSLPDYSSPEETIALYRILVEERAILTIDNIDEYGKPWTAYFYVVENNNGQGHHILTAAGDAIEATAESYTCHTIATDDDSWEKVEAE
ncbi:MAG: hypothetical protein V4671_29980 [Armatimonadota bacterium]